MIVLLTGHTKMGIPIIEMRATEAETTEEETNEVRKEVQRCDTE